MGQSGKQSGGETGTLSAETIFDTLSAQRRRYTLHYLLQVGEPVSIRDLSEQVAAWENGIERSAVTPKERKRVYTGLHQTHLPKMDRAGVVEFDRDRGTVARTDRVEEFDLYLDVAAGDEVPWSQFYLGLAAVLTALVSVAALGVPPFAALGGFGYALVTALTFAAAATYHVFRDKQARIGATATPPGACPPPAEAAGGEDG